MYSVVKRCIAGIVLGVILGSIFGLVTVAKKQSKQIAYLAHQYSCLNATCIASCHK